MNRIAPERRRTAYNKTFKPDVGRKRDIRISLFSLGTKTTEAEQRYYFK